MIRLPTVRLRWFCRGLLALAMGLGAACSPEAGEPERRGYILATATTGGTYYPVGVALATVTKVKLAPETGISLAAISSAGSAENVRLLRKGEAQFAILQGLYGAWAWNGEGPLEGQGPQTYLRSVTLLWPNVEHYTIRAEFAGTGTMADLANLEGRRFSIGAKNSGAEGAARHILGNLGLDPDTAFSLVYQGYGPSAEALQNGQIAGMNTPAGVPVGAVTRAFAADGGNLRLLSFTPEQREAADGGYGLYTAFEIPAGTYPNQDAAVTTIAQPNILAVRADVDDDAVYRVTKAIYENLAFLRGIHSATAAMALEDAVTGLPAPLHPGALRYYREQGLDVPDRLVPPEARVAATGAAG